jgi:hypothetical protein
MSSDDLEILVKLNNLAAVAEAVADPKMGQ